MIKAVKLICPKRGCKSEKFSTKGIDEYNDKYLEYKVCDNCGQTFKLYLDIVIIPSKIEKVEKSIITKRYSEDFLIVHQEDFNNK